MLQAAPGLLTAQTASVKPFGHLPPRRLTTPSRLTNTTAPHKDAAQTLQTLAAAAVSSPMTSNSFGRDSMSSRISAASSKVYLGKKAVVVGAGPAGVTAAMYLAQRGFAVQVRGSCRQAGLCCTDMVHQDGTCAALACTRRSR
jgi:hypothetical protein